MEITVREVPNQRLEITGTDAHGDVIARLELTNGRFYFDEFEAEVTGRQMTLDVLGQRAEHKSAGFKNLKLPALGLVEAQVANDFLYDHRVQVALSRWGVGMRERPVPALFPSTNERPHAYTCGSTGQFATSSSCASTSCEYDFEFLGEIDNECRFGYVQAVCCGGTGNYSQRACGAGSWNQCGAEGPNGCSVCWVQPYGSSCNAQVWASGDAWCQDAPYPHSYVHFDL